MHMTPKKEYDREEKLTVEAVVERGRMQSPVFDPQGSYTGNPKDGQHPVQDADDL